MKKGFTLIELVMVIIILGVLASVAVPRYSNLTSQANVSAAKGALGSIRAAISLTYGSNLVLKVSNPVPQSIYPSMFQDQAIPVEPISNSNSVSFVASESLIGSGSGWAYDSLHGRAWINNSSYTNF